MRRPLHPFRSFPARLIHGVVFRSQLSENIIKVLRSMLCPHPLQANQIQGSDFAAMFPVIQWLVTKVLFTQCCVVQAVCGI